MAPVSWIGFKADLKAAEPLRGDSTTKSSGVPGVHIIDFEKLES